MEAFSSVEEVIKRAIQLEIEAEALYNNAAGTVKDEEVHKRLLEMAEQERGHKSKLEDILAGNVRWAVRMAKTRPVEDLRLSDHLMAGSLDPDADYQDVLLYAARREKDAHDFYKAMAEMVDDKLTQSVFEMLAQEELRHKYILEKTYEDVAYQDF